MVGQESDNYGISNNVVEEVLPALKERAPEFEGGQDNVKIYLK